MGKKYKYKLKLEDLSSIFQFVDERSCLFLAVMLKKILWEISSYVFCNIDSFVKKKLPMKYKLFIKLYVNLILN